MTKLESIQKELRHQRQDHRDMSYKIDRLLVDKHVQMQVDEYFKEDETSPQTDTEEPPRVSSSDMD